MGYFSDVTIFHPALPALPCILYHQNMLLPASRPFRFSVQWILPMLLLVLALILKGTPVQPCATCGIVVPELTQRPCPLCMVLPNTLPFGVLPLDGDKFLLAVPVN